MEDQDKDQLINELAVLRQRVAELEQLCTDREQIEAALRDTEQRLELALKGADLVMWDVNVQTAQAVYWPERLSTSGYLVGEMEPTIAAWGSRVHPEDLNLIRKAFNAHAKGRLPLFECEYRLEGKDGHWRWVLSRGKIMELDGSGNPLRMMGTSYDVTVRKKAELMMQGKHEELERLVQERTNELSKEKERFKLLAEHSPFAMIIIQPDGQFSYANPRFKEVFGYDLTDVSTGKEWFRKAFPDSAYRHEVISAWIGDVQEKDAGERRTRSYTVTCKEGTEKIVDFRPVKLDSGEIIVTCEDTTERQRAENQIIQEKERWERTFDTVPDLVHVSDEQQRVIRANRPMLLKLGLSAQELIGKKCHEVIHGLDAPPHFCPHVKAMNDGKEHAVEMTEPRLGGTFLVTSSPLFDPEGILTGAVHVARDITERKALEENLKFERDQFLSVFDSLGIPMGVVDPQTYEIVFLNKFKADLVGYDAIGKHCYEVFRGLDVPCEDCNNDLVMKLKGAPHHWEGHSDRFGKYFSHTDRMIRWPDGRDVKLELAIDTTERKRAEEERLEMARCMHRAQKLESLGLMAGGIAHDFNNLLHVVMGNLELAKKELPPGSPAHNNITSAFQAAQRSAELSLKMLAYSGRTMFMPRDLGINEVIEKNTGKLKAVVSKKVVLALRTGKDLPPVSGDVTQILQVLTNLVINASEAIGDKGGEIQVTTGCMDCDEAYLRSNRIHNNPAPGRFVFLEVTDTGCGMDQKTQELFFDPFYTTKFIGRGLGMSAVMGIVKGHGGAILLDSKTGRGTTIRILFPVSENVVHHHVSETETVIITEPAQEISSETRNILVVDDDEGVLHLALTLLRRMGFDVIPARNGEEAIRLFKVHQDFITGVVLDYSMPRMDGIEVFKELKRIRPDVKVVLCSGYTEEDTCGSHERVGLAGFIRKPYALAQLREMIEQVLGPALPEIRQ